jgi:predicted O-methyltransferase YrrM
MDTSTRAVLDDLAEHGARHDAGLTDRLQRLRNMKPDAAALIGLLVRLQRGPRILEIGTSNGYSTIWLADAARDHGGRLVSVEIDPGRVAQARVNLARAGLTDVAEVRHADGLEVLAATPDSSVTGVVLDAERPAYAAYWPHVLRILAPGGFVAVDNALSHADELTVFRDLVDTTPGAHSDLLDLGDGLLIITRRDTPRHSHTRGHDQQLPAVLGLRSPEQQRDGDQHDGGGGAVNAERGRLGPVMTQNDGGVGGRDDGGGQHQPPQQVLLPGDHAAIDAPEPGNPVSIRVSPSGSRHR